MGIEAKHRLADMDYVIGADRGEPRTVQFSIVCVLTLDAAHCIDYSNSEFERACGYGQGELLLRPLDHVVHQDVPREVLRDVWATLAEGATWVAPLKWHCANGQPVWTRTAFAPIRRMSTVNQSMVVGTHASPAQAHAAEGVFLAMRRRGLTWREAVARCTRSAPADAGAPGRRSC